MVIIFRILIVFFLVGNLLSTNFSLAFKEARDDLTDWYRVSNDAIVEPANEALVKSQLNSSSKLNDVTQAERKVLYEVAEKEILWTQIDEFDTYYNSHYVTFYDVRVIYQVSRERAGYAFEENGILFFDLNEPQQIQNQGVGTEIFQRAIAEYSPNQIQGVWKTSDSYFEGESLNLTIFKQKISEGLSPIQAVFETPTGKILKDNGFHGTPVILMNTQEEVQIIFNKP